MKVNEMYPRKYVSGEELDGKAYAGTIDEVRAEQVQMQGAKPETKYVLYLAGTRKGIIMSRTLAEQIQGIVGSDETADWVGHKIVIYPVPMTVAGKQRVAIRARAPKAEAADAAELKHDEEEE